MLLWERRNADVVSNVGVGGDFLPPYEPTASERADWVQHAMKLTPYLADLDIGFANLEGPLDIDGLLPRPKAGLGVNLGGREKALEFLAKLRITVIGLANNHIYDYGPEGLSRTREAIVRRGMIPLGCGRSLEEDPEVFVWTGPADVRVGFWAAATNTMNPATTRQQGVEVATLCRGRGALSQMKARGATCCIALLHAGYERTNYPDPETVRLAASLARAGFDVVAACHSHRISGYSLIERQEGEQRAAIFYGLGSVFSAIMYSDLEREGLMAVIGLGPDGVVNRIEARPLYLSGEQGYGSVPTSAQSEIISNRLVRLSKEIETGEYAGLFYQDVTQGFVRTQVQDAIVAFKHGGAQGVGKKIRRLRPTHLRIVASRLAPQWERMRDRARGPREEG